MGGPLFNQPVEGIDNGIKLYGVRGRSKSGSGFGVVGQSDSFDGVHGVNESGGVGVSGFSRNGVDGVFGRSRSGRGVFGWSNDREGVHGLSFTNAGVSGSSISGPGVFGLSNRSSGVHGFSSQNIGVFGFSSISDGVRGISDSSGDGVLGYSYSGIGVHGVSSFGYAAFLDGRVFIRGPLQKPDMKNIYDGVVVLDDKGEAEIELPDWFGALNKDFRYQLTAISAPGPNLHIAEEISDGVTNYSNSSSSNNKDNNNSRFKVAGGTSGMKVSWQVTGIRKDPWANANRIKVEEDKPANERGYYMYPDFYGKAAEKGISRLLFPTEEEKEKKQEQLINDHNKLT
jgi:hypothetical protein